MSPANDDTLSEGGTGIDFPGIGQMDIAQAFGQALAWHQQGQLIRAKHSYEHILSMQELHFDANHLLGVIACQLGDFDLSISLIEKAIRIHPRHVKAHTNLAFAMRRAGRFDEAVRSYDNAVLLNPVDADIYFQRAITLAAQESYREAIGSYDKAIHINPKFADALNNRGIALSKLQNIEAAVDSYQQAIAARPSFPEAYFNLGNALQSMGKLNAALSAYTQAITIKPDYFDALMNSGNVLKKLSRLGEAAISYQKSIQVQPANFEAHLNFGVALHEMNRLEDAITSYDCAISIQPDYAEAYWNKSLALLLSGDLLQGFALHEWRWKRNSFSSPKRDFHQALWLGVEPVQGKTLLLHAEQGLGDTLQFARYLKLLAPLGAKLILEAPHSLAGVMASIQADMHIVIQGNALPSFDLHCPMMSLPLAFMADLTNIPFAAGYIFSDMAKSKLWELRLGPKRKPRVGLVWSGNPIHKNDSNRSLALADLMRHLPDGFDYFSLQKELREGESLSFEGRTLRQFGAELIDFSDTAALCEAMDLVISVDTSVVHLAGALGKQTWVLLPYAPDWRWLLDRTDSPWYASITLYRQNEDRQWPQVLEKIAIDLKKYLF